MRSGAIARVNVSTTQEVLTMNQIAEWWTGSFWQWVWLLSWTVPVACGCLSGWLDTRRM